MVQHGLPYIARFAGIAAVTVSLGLVGCSQEQAAQGDVTPSEEATVALPHVVATTSVLCDLTEQIAQDTIALTCLMEPGQDPHTYQVKPSDRQAIDEADLVLYDGYDFAPSLIGLVEASSNPAPKIAVYESAVPEPLMGEKHDHDHSHAEGEAHDHEDNTAAIEESHDHGEGEIHDSSDEELVVDPHIWHRATNNGAIAQAIATHLAQVNPDQTDLYQGNVVALTEQFAELDAWIQAQVNTIPADHRKLITTHDAFSYYADAYGLEVKGALSGVSTEEQPSARVLTRLIDQVKAAQVPAIFAETTANPDLINTIASSANVNVAERPLFVEGPGGPGTQAETIQAMLVSNTCTIVNALGGTCDEGEAPL